MLFKGAVQNEPYNVNMVGSRLERETFALNESLALGTNTIARLE